MKQEEFDRKALDVVIFTDTLVIKNDVLLTNFKSLKIVARKVLVTKSSQPVVTLRTLARPKSSWVGDTAPGKFNIFSPIQVNPKQ